MNKIFATLLLSAFALTGCSSTQSAPVTESESLQATQQVQRNQPIQDARQVEYAANVVDLARLRIDEAPPVQVVLSAPSSKYSDEYQGRQGCIQLGFEVPAKEMVRATSIGSYGDQPLPTSIDDPRLLAESTLENALDYVDSNNVEIVCVGDPSSEPAKQFYESTSGGWGTQLGNGATAYNLPFGVVDGLNIVSKAPAYDY